MQLHLEEIPLVLPPAVEPVNGSVQGEAAPKTPTEGKVSSPLRRAPPLPPPAMKVPSKVKQTITHKKAEIGHTRSMVGMMEHAGKHIYICL